MLPLHRLFPRHIRPWQGAAGRLIAFFEASFLCSGQFISCQKAAAWLPCCSHLTPLWALFLHHWNLVAKSDPSQRYCEDSRGSLSSVFSVPPHLASPAATPTSSRDLLSGLQLLSADCPPPTRSTWGLDTGLCPQGQKNQLEREECARRTTLS